jgi:hypothetical protein
MSDGITPGRSRPDARANRARQSDAREEVVREGMALDRAGRPVTRKRNSSVDRYYVQPGKIPDGWSYEWKRWAVMNQEDPSYLISLQENGWEAVPAGRHPELVANGVNGEAAIIRDGMILMERPAQLTAEAKQEDIEIARGMIRDKQRQLGETPNGTLPRDAHREVRPRLGRAYEAMPIPEDADQPIE